MFKRRKTDAMTELLAAIEPLAAIRVTAFDRFTLPIGSLPIHRPKIAALQEASARLSKKQLDGTYCRLLDDWRARRLTREAKVLAQQLKRPRRTTGR